VAEYVVAGRRRGSVWPAWVCLVVCRNGLSGDGAVAADLEAVAGCPFPDFGRAGLPSRAGDLGVRLPGPGHFDGLSDEVGGPPRSFHGELGEYGAGEFVYGLAGSLVFQLAHGLGEFFKAEGADRVVEQAVLGSAGRGGMPSR